MTSGLPTRVAGPAIKPFRGSVTTRNRENVNPSLLTDAAAMKTSSRHWPSVGKRVRVELLID